MDKKIKKCSNKKHLEIDAISYCQECKIYLCNTCQDLHLGLFEDHHLFNLDKEDINELFSDKCQIENHHEKCEYFCKNHNQLCCVACISKIKDELHRQHRDCNVCLLKDIEDEKKNQLNENIKILEDLSNIIENKINEIKILYEKVNNNKEELKTKIQNIFTKIRNILNEREDELLLYIDTKFNQLFINEELVKESEKLPNEIQNSLEKSRLIEKEWNNNNKLNILINNCINIENNIKEINILSQNINKCNINKNILFQISKTEDEINYCLYTIKSFKVYYSKYRFRNCPINLEESRKYEISGDNDNIVTKTGNNGWIAVICKNELEKGKENKWKIKLLKKEYKNIIVGVAPIDFDIYSSTISTCGWYLDCCLGYSNPTLFSGPPHNYKKISTILSKVKDEIIVIMDMNKGTLKFIIDNQDKGNSYINIPINKPLFPAVFLYDKNNSVEILEI